MVGSSPVRLLFFIAFVLAGFIAADSMLDGHKPSSILMPLPSARSPTAAAVRVVQLPLGESVNFLQFNNGSLNSGILFVGVGNIPQYCSSSSLVYRLTHFIFSLSNLI